MNRFIAIPFLAFGSSESCLRRLRRDGEQPIEIAAENLPALRLRDAELLQDLLLHLVNRPLPAAREERRVGAEQQPIRARHLERVPEHVVEAQAGMEARPTVRAGGVEMDRGALV